jgi:hypothetical protein
LSNVPLIVADRGCFNSSEKNSTCSFPFNFANFGDVGTIGEEQDTTLTFPLSGNHIPGQDSFLKITLSQDDGQQLWVASSLSNKYVIKYSNQALMTELGGDIDTSFATNSDLLSLTTLTSGRGISEEHVNLTGI